MISLMKFFTWCNDPTDVRLEPLIKSAAMNQIELQYVGLGVKKWRNYDKLKYLNQILKAIPPDEVVCVVDAFDVFFQDNEQVILRKFESFDSDVVFSAERGYSQQYRKYQNYYDKVSPEGPYKYLNSGTVIGKAWALSKLYKTSLVGDVKNFILDRKYLVNASNQMTYYKNRVFKLLFRSKQVSGPPFYSPWYFFSDQTHLGVEIARKSNIKIMLDYKTELFWCTAYEWEDLKNHFYFEDGRIINKHTLNQPSMVHVPYGKVYENEFLKLFNEFYNRNLESD